MLGEASVPVHPRSASGGAVEQDPRNCSRRCSRPDARPSGRRRRRLDAVGLANQGETVLRWDRASGRALGPALSWQDRRAVVVTRELAGRAERLTELTGLPLDPYFAAPKMSWLRRHAGARGSHDDRRRLAEPAPGRGLRDRRGDGLSHVAARPRRRTGRRRRAPPSACRPSSSRGSSTAHSRSARPRRSGAAAAQRPRRRPAGGAARAVVLQRRGGEVHLRHRRLHPRQRRRAAAALALRTRRLRGLAPAGDETTYCLDGQVHTRRLGRGLARARSG